MAVYDGFFDAALDEETEQYEPSYDSGDFSGYFGQVIGSGVCIYRNANSMAVRFSDGAAVVSPGYLFIDGYWLKNDADYAIPLTGAGTFAILAHLNLGAPVIELKAQLKANPEVYPDSLVLAYVTVSGGSGTVEDTRHNTGICGVIDAVGSLSGKLEYALNYIDTEIESKLAQAEADIEAQAARLNAKIAEVAGMVERLSPPPVGSIKFSAAEQQGDEWLKCDGSFISEDDYPELVAALGKVTPGAAEFSEILGATLAEQTSNCCVVDGTTWIYLLKSRKLVGLAGDARTEIAVTGADALLELPALDTVLSICDGSLYLAQMVATQAACTLLECARFAGTETSIEMTELDITSKIKTYSNLDWFVPKVTAYEGYRYIAAGTYVSTSLLAGSPLNSIYISILKWAAGSFDDLSYFRLEYILKTAYISGQSPSDIEVNGKKAAKTLLAFNPKNSDELLAAQCAVLAAGGEINLTFGTCSVERQLYGVVAPNLSAISSSRAQKYYERLVADNYDPGLNILPVAARDEYLYRAAIEKRRLTIDYGTYNPKSVFDWKTIDVLLPSGARLFKESVCYASAPGLWIVFVGTGILFTTSLASGDWGYMDTAGTIGAVTRFGCADYDVSGNCLFLSGTNTAGMPIVGRLKMTNVLDYASNGVVLPNLSSGGIPAYIKAKGAVT